MKKIIFLLAISIMTGLIQLCKAQPVANCKDITVSLQRINHAHFSVTINPTDVDNGSSSPVGIQRYTLDKMTFIFTPSSSDLGPNPVILTITDNNGNTSTCTAIVTVLAGPAAIPVAQCKDITVNLDENGNKILNSSEVDNGSYSLDGIQRFDLSVESFSCDDLGPQVVTLSIIDNGGNTASCNSIVTIEDKIKPISICKNITVDLDQTGNVFLTSTLIDNGSYDACGIRELNINPTLLNCANIGITNNVTLTVVDNNGNTSTCISNVVVKDNIPPEAICRNVTKILNSNGSTTITPTELNSNSKDACGIASIDIAKSEQTMFTCNEIGERDIILLVTDNYGNQSGCIARIKIENTIPPDANCKNIEVRLDKSGNATILSDELDNGSTSICGIRDIDASQKTFSRIDIGTPTVILKVTDNNGNTETCTATVTVSAPPDTLIGKVFNISNTPIFSTDRFNTLEIDGQNNIYAGASGSGVYLFQNDIWSSIPNEFGMNGYVVRSMRRNPANDDIWVGMSKTSPCLGQVGGMWIYNSGNFVRRYVPPKPPNGFDESLSLAELNILLSVSGIPYTLPPGSTYLNFLEIYNNAFPSLVVRSLDFNKKTGEPWAGFTPQLCEPGYNGGLAIQRTTLEPLPTSFWESIKDNMPPYGNQDRMVTAIASDPENGMVYAAIRRSCNTNCVDPFIMIRNSDGTYFGKYDQANTPVLPLNPNKEIRAMLVDKSGRLWVGGDLNGIGVRDINGWHFLSSLDIPYPDGGFIHFDAITEGPDGSIYFGTTNGLLQFIGGELTVKANWRKIQLKAANLENQLPDLQNICSIKFDNNDNIWIATRGGGIFYHKSPGVYNVIIDQGRRKLKKQPLKDVLVRAFLGDNQIGPDIRTNEDGEFGLIDKPLNAEFTYNLKFNYFSSSGDTLDDNFEFVHYGYRVGEPIDDILLPVKMLKQSRLLVNSITKDASKKYELTILKYALETGPNKAVYDLSLINQNLNSWKSADNTSINNLIDDIGRQYLAILINKDLSNNVYELLKIAPTAMIGIVTTAIDFIIEYVDLKNKGVKTEDNEISEAAVLSAINAVLDEAAIILNKQAVETKVASLSEAYKKAIPILQLLKSTIEGTSKIGKSKSKEDLYSLTKTILSDILSSAIFVTAHKAYISHTQKFINSINDNIHLNDNLDSDFRTVSSNFTKTFLNLANLAENVQGFNSQVLNSSQSFSDAADQAGILHSGINSIIHFTLLGNDKLAKIAKKILLIKNLVFTVIPLTTYKEIVKDSGIAISATIAAQKQVVNKAFEIQN